MARHVHIVVVLARISPDEHFHDSRVRTSKRAIQKLEPNVSTCKAPRTDAAPTKRLGQLSLYMLVNAALHVSICYPVGWLIHLIQTNALISWCSPPRRRTQEKIVGKIFWRAKLGSQSRTEEWKAPIEKIQVTKTSFLYSGDKIFYSHAHVILKLSPFC